MNREYAHGWFTSDVKHNPTWCNRLTIFVRLCEFDFLEEFLNKTNENVYCKNVFHFGTPGEMQTKTIQINF